MADTKARQAFTVKRQYGQKRKFHEGNSHRFLKSVQEAVAAETEVEETDRHRQITHHHSSYGCLHIAVTPVPDITATDLLVRGFFPHWMQKWSLFISTQHRFNRLKLSGHKVLHTKHWRAMIRQKDGKSSNRWAVNQKWADLEWNFSIMRDLCNTVSIIHWAVAIQQLFSSFFSFFVSAWLSFGWVTRSEASLHLL